jgi:hypothetical protein
MHIRLDDPKLARELYDLLAEEASCIARLDGSEIEAALVGSYADGGAAALTEVVREWQREHPGVEVEARE